ncbi:MAG: efflux RND transporter permease subunit [Verrucomicrobiota bacterium]
MNLADFTLRNNRTSLVIYGALLVLGLQTFFSVGRLEYPDFTIRNAQIITTYSGRTSIQVEQEISDPLESALRQMAEVKEITSTSKNGISVLSVELRDKYFDLQPIWQDMRNRIESTTLPDGAGVPIVNDDDFAEIFPYIYSISGDGFTNREIYDYGEVLEDVVLTIPGVARVEFDGKRDERVFIEFSSNELASYGFTPEDIAREISQQNAIVSSGDLSVSKERITVLTRGEFESLDEIGSLRFAIPGDSTTLRLTDIATISRGYVDPPTSIAHVNGERVITMAVSMVDGGVVTEIGNEIDRKIRETAATFPIGVEVESIFFQPEYVTATIDNFISNLGQAFFFVVLVMFLFAGFRIALVVGVLVPSAILICFAFMPAAGVQLEMMSIAALIIALGLLVDNAVVVSEQILVRLGNGEDRHSACTGAVSNLAISLLASSATTIAAFSVVALASGSASEFTFSLFAVVSMTLVASWLLSITIIPLFCFYFLKPLENETYIGRLFQRVYGPYEKLLRFSLRRKLLFPIVIFGLTVIAIGSFALIPSIFFPPNERGQFTADFELPLGSDLLEVERQALKLETWIEENHGDEIRNVSVWIGDGGPRWYLSLSPEPPSSNYAFFNILTKSGDPADVARIKESVSAHATTNFPDVRFSAKLLESGPPVGSPIQVRLYGTDLKTIYGLRDQIANELRNTADLHSVHDDWGAWVKQIVVNPDPIQASRIGLDTESIASALGTQYSGETASIYREGDNAIPIVLRSHDAFRNHPERIRDIPIHGAVGGAVPLSQVATVGTELLPGSIQREDSVRTMTIEAEVSGRYASEALADVQPRLDALAEGFPAGYRIEYGGEQEESAESQASIGSAMPISFGLLSLILIAQFNSLRCFSVIILTIPPMLVGIVPGLLITGSTFGFMTLLGMIALLGIIVNNAILLIDEINTRSAANDTPLDEAIVASAKSRLRPIVMTSLTTIIGLMPLAIAGGGMWTSMANAMMFGLGFATILTLVLCPTLMGLFFRARNRTKAAKP